MPARSLGLAGGGGFADGSDGVCRRAQPMVGHVRGRRCVSGGARHVARHRVGDASRRRMGCDGGLTRLTGRGLTARPCTGDLDRAERLVVVRALGSKQWKDVLGAIRGPGRKQAVAGLVEKAAPVLSH